MIEFILILYSCKSYNIVAYIISRVCLGGGGGWGLGNFPKIFWTAKTAQNKCARGAMKKKKTKHVFFLLSFGSSLSQVLFWYSRVDHAGLQTIFLYLDLACMTPILGDQSKREPLTTLNKLF